MNKNTSMDTHMTTRTKDFGEDLVFSPVELSHGPIFVKTLSYKESIEFLKVREKNSDSINPYEILENNNSQKIRFGVFFKFFPVGEVTLWNIKDSACYISYWIDENYRNRGIATIAVALVTDYAFSTLDFEEVEAPILPENEASKDLIQKLFFTISGYETFTGKDGIQRAHEMYLQLKPSEQEEMSLIEYVEGRYSFDE